MSRDRRAVVRFYVDACLAGLAKTLVTLRADVTYPGDPGGVLHRRRRDACPIVEPGTSDRVWIRDVASRGWLIITRDVNIQAHPSELAAVRESGAKMINLSSEDAGTKWEQLRVVLAQWPEIERLHGVPGPFIYRATRTRLTPVSLETGLGISRRPAGGG